jgi:D-alanyl-D-alanine carboxypeptidase/D-alanyl-D-alanine-endopeptidase (penicillin-binding protein 4)
LLPSISAPSPDLSNDVLLHEERSIGMHGLLSLANTESHNFTSEVLLRQAAGSWDLQQARLRAMQWLSMQGIPMEGVRVVDGSGLDRGNRLTSRALAALLLRMAQHPLANHYVASMAIAGQRGTLRHLWQNSQLDGKFYGKTGTISGVRSISGVLISPDGPRYISMISNGASSPNSTIGSLLRQAQTAGLCPAS